MKITNRFLIVLSIFLLLSSLIYSLADIEDKLTVGGAVNITSNGDINATKVYAIIHGDPFNGTDASFKDVNSTNINITNDLSINKDINISPFFWLVERPTNNFHVVNKNYVDDVTSATAFDFFFSNFSSNIGSHFNMTSVDLGRSETTESSASLGAGVDQSIFNWTTNINDPEFTVLRQGVFDLHIHLSKTGLKPVTITPKLYNISSDGTDRNLLIVFENTSEITSDVTEYDIHGILINSTMLGDDTRLNLELEASVGVAGSDITIIVTMEGISDSHLTVETTSQSFSNIFVRQDGSTPLSGNWDAGSFRITSDGARITDYRRINFTSDFNDIYNITDSDLLFNESDILMNNSYVGSGTETIDWDGFIMDGKSQFILGSLGVEGNVTIDGDLRVAGRVRINEINLTIMNATSAQFLNEATGESVNISDGIIRASKNLHVSEDVFFGAGNSNFALRLEGSSTNQITSTTENGIRIVRINSDSDSFGWRANNLFTVANFGIDVFNVSGTNSFLKGTFTANQFISRTSILSEGVRVTDYDRENFTENFNDIYNISDSDLLFNDTDHEITKLIITPNADNVVLIKFDLDRDYEFVTNRSDANTELSLVYRAGNKWFNIRGANKAEPFKVFGGNSPSDDIVTLIETDGRVGIGTISPEVPKGLDIANGGILTGTSDAGLGVERAMILIKGDIDSSGMNPNQMREGSFWISNDAPGAGTVNNKACLNFVPDASSGITDTASLCGLWKGNNVNDWVIYNGNTENFRIKYTGDIIADGGGFFYNDTLNRFALGTTLPQVTLDVRGSARFSSPNPILTINDTDTLTGYNILATGTELIINVNKSVNPLTDMLRFEPDQGEIEVPNNFDLNITGVLHGGAAGGRTDTGRVVWCDGTDGDTDTGNECCHIYSMTCNDVWSDNQFDGDITYGFGCASDFGGFIFIALCY